jgi:co-chaperonin GroES (HSP10)
MIRPLGNAVFFQFADETSVTRFNNKTKTGIIIAGGDQSEVARWGKVTDVGPEVRDITVGDYVLIEKGMWTQGFDAGDNKRTWKTDEEKICVVSSEPIASF